MPYAANAQIPIAVRKALPDAAQTIWRKAFNSALRQYGGDEGRAASVAWSAVKAKYRKGTTGTWLMREAVWDTSYVNNLPDSAFAYIEPGGKRDAQGRTVPRSKRHFPIRNAQGQYDPAHVRNALARAPQSPFGAKAMPKIQAAATSLRIGEFTKKEAVETREFEEAISLSDIRVDREKRTLLGISILGGKSKHGYGWTREAMKSVATLLESVKVFVNHQTHSGFPNVRDLLGTLKNPRYDPQTDRVRADMQVRVGPDGDQLLADAEHNPQMGGFSIQHESEYNPMTNFVEKTLKVLRVDYVATPATTGGMFEAANCEEDMEMDYGEITLDELREKRPELCAALVADAQDTSEIEGLKAKVQAFESEKAQLTTKVAAFEQADAQRKRESTAEKLMEEAKLDKKVRETLRPELVKLETQESMAAIVRTVAESAAAHHTISDEPRGGGDDQSDESDRAKLRASWG